MISHPVRGWQYTKWCRNPVNHQRLHPGTLQPSHAMFSYTPSMNEPANIPMKPRLFIPTMAVAQAMAFLVKSRSLSAKVVLHDVVLGL